MPPFLVCIHDATPAYARELRVMMRDLAPLLGRRCSFGVVPNWNGEWPLGAHPDYCRLLRQSAEELLLHGFFHRRRRGWGPTTWLVDGSDEMNGLDAEETRRTLERGQHVFTEVFGEPARGFIAPAWQRGHVRPGADVILRRDPQPNVILGHGTQPDVILGHRTQPNGNTGLNHVLGFFSVESQTGRKVRLATWTWDCGRWGWLGHIGHGIGWLLQSLDRGVPSLAIHPSDMERGFWPGILRLIRDLLDIGYEPTTAAGLLEASEC